MPAKRSRTLEWRRCLNDIHRRNGSIEIAIANHDDAGELDGQLVWRVRLLDINESELVVEQPAALGQTIPIKSDIQLAAAISIGQNRWMFSTVSKGTRSYQEGGFSISALVIDAPRRVERCQRRNYYRVNTASITLPRVQLWPLLDPKSVVLAERSNELQFEAMMNGGEHAPAEGTTIFPEVDILPEVGPQFEGELLNIGGGGVGMRIAPDHGQPIQRHKMFWLRINLRNEMMIPICATAKLAHTHLESSQHYYAGLSFDFSHNPGHQRFVADQICRYIAVRQREQFENLQRRSA